MIYDWSLFISLLTPATDLLNDILFFASLFFFTNNAFPNDPSPIFFTRTYRSITSACEEVQTSTFLQWALTFPPYL